MHQFSVKHAQSQSIILSKCLKQGLSILQMPLPDLENWLEDQIAKNPFLDNLPRTPLQGIATVDLPKKPSRYEYLMKQASLHFQNQELKLACEIIGNLDEKGFFQKTNLTEKEAEILEVIQGFDPPGIAAQNLQECLLIQLKIKKKQKSLAFQVISQAYSLLLHQKWDKICKTFKVSKSELLKVIHRDISSLTLNPSHMFEYEPTKLVYPDISFEEKEDGLDLKIKEVIHFKITNPYKIKDKESEKWIEKNIKSIQWLQKNLKTREFFLQKVGQILLKTNLMFIKGEKDITPISISDIANKLGIHLSTAHRVISNKYVSTPKGIFPLKIFFKSSMRSTKGEKISNLKIFNQLKLIVHAENKNRPLSDLEIVKKLQAQGIKIARRTLTKYREKLKIPSARMRKAKNIN
ncbi:MAG: RNA polymerase sigma-54 factor [Chlamydiae bacterium CG10_big_fil_rev_8_21_14_0_10_35_9]|nr:MAG: RNA polymerase sigma-54 factor [Chlamydiae bacterium CG10_big_fil_rev_8_21_14_0_10_35_9]